MRRLPFPAAEWSFSLWRVRASLWTGCNQEPWKVGAPTQNQEAMGKRTCWLDPLPSPRTLATQPAPSRWGPQSWQSWAAEEERMKDLTCELPHRNDACWPLNNCPSQTSSTSNYGRVDNHASTLNLGGPLTVPEGNHLCRKKMKLWISSDGQYLDSKKQATLWKFRGQNRAVKFKI